MQDWVHRVILNVNDGVRGILFIKCLSGTQGLFKTTQSIPVAKVRKLLDKIIGWLRLQQRQRWTGCRN